MLKLSIIFTLIALTLAQSADDAKRQERVFNQWLKKYNLDVAENADFDAWKSQVIKKFKEVEAHNQKFRRGEVKFRKALNHLSHLTPEQRKATLMGFEATDAQNGVTVDKIDPALVKDFPDYWNWADHGIIQPVQNQNPCGSCYIFASIGAIEGHSCLYGNMCEKLSEQEALDCSYRGCKGGNAGIVYTYARNSDGAAYGKDYKYRGRQLGSCKVNLRSRAPRTKVLDWKKMPNDEATIRYYLKTAGPMFMGFMYYESMTNYQDGIMDKAEGKLHGGHAVLLTGYGTENGTDYWILKNSWKPTWGENGYFRLQRGVNLGECESLGPSYPIVQVI